MDDIPVGRLYSGRVPEYPQERRRLFVVSSHRNRCKISRNSRSRAGRITRVLVGTIVLRNQILTLPDYPQIGARSQGTYVIVLAGLMFGGGIQVVYAR